MNNNFSNNANLIKVILFYPKVQTANLKTIKSGFLCSINIYWISYFSWSFNNMEIGY